MLSHKLEAYVRRDHYNVSGWLQPGAVEVICRINKVQIEDGVTGHVAEIGVHHGRLFILLALLARVNEKAVAIDLFDQQELNPENSGKKDLVQFRKNLEQYGNPSSLVIHAGDSTKVDGQAVIAMADGPIRLFSVDGGHTAAITHHDLETAEAALAPGGVIILDDYFNEDWPDVSTGFHRFFSTPRKIVPFAIGANKLFLTTADMTQKYKAALAAAGMDMSAREFIGQPVYCFSFKNSLLIYRIEQWIKNHPKWKTIKNLPGVPALRRFYFRVRYSIFRDG